MQITKKNVFLSPWDFLHFPTSCNIRFLGTKFQYYQNMEETILAQMDLGNRTAICLK